GLVNHCAAYFGHSYIFKNIKIRRRFFSCKPYFVSLDTDHTPFSATILCSDESRGPSLMLYILVQEQVASSTLTCFSSHCESLRFPNQQFQLSIHKLHLCFQLSSRIRILEISQCCQVG